MTAVSMRSTLGTKSILYCMRYLQLFWLGAIRRMDADRLPRKLLTSRLPLKRGAGRPISDFSDIILKALASAGIEEGERFMLVADEFW